MVKLQHPNVEAPGFGFETIGIWLGQACGFARWRSAQAEWGEVVNEKQTTDEQLPNPSVAI